MTPGNTTSPCHDLGESVRAWRQHPDALTQLQEIYRDVDRRLAQLQPRCLGGGCCCKFDLAGHRLYLSTGELALLVEQPPPALAQARKLRCPYQVGPRCAARQRRSLGCRLFFCGEHLTNRSHTLYEEYHQRIRNLAETSRLPYAYVELTAAMLQLFDNT